MAAKHLLILLLALFACTVAQSVDELNIPDENDNQFPPVNHADGIEASEVKVTTIEPDIPYQITESEFKGLDSTNAADKIVTEIADSVKGVSEDSGLNKVTLGTNEVNSDITQTSQDVTEAVGPLNELKVASSVASNEVVTDAVTEPSVALTESSVAFSEPSVAFTEPSVAYTEPSVAFTEHSVAYTEPLVAFTEPSVANSEPSAQVTETSIAFTEPSVANSEPSAQVTETSIAFTEPTVAVAEVSITNTQPSEEVSEPSAAVTTNTVYESDAILAGDEPPRVTEDLETSDSVQTTVVETTDTQQLQDITNAAVITTVPSEINTTDNPTQTTLASTQLFSTGNGDDTQTETAHTGDDNISITTETNKAEVNVNAFNLPLDIPNGEKPEVDSQDLKSTLELYKVNSEDSQAPKQVDDEPNSAVSAGETIKTDLPNKTVDSPVPFGNIQPSIVGVAQEQSLVTETTESPFKTTIGTVESTDSTSSNKNIPTEISTESPEPTTDLPRNTLENDLTVLPAGNSLLVTEEPRPCPESCICITQGDFDGFKVDCSGRQLTALPKPLDPKTTELDIQNNNLTEISDEISALTKLKVLNANNNDIMEIMSGSLSKLPELTSLNLGNNRLLDYPQELMNFGLTKLKELDLGGNDMELKPEIFSNYTSLRKLILPAAKSDIAKHLCNNLKESLQTVCTGTCDTAAINCSDASEQLKKTIDYTLPGLIPLNKPPNNVEAAIDNKTELKGIKQIVGEVSTSTPLEGTAAKVENAVPKKEDVVAPPEVKDSQPLPIEKPNISESSAKDKNNLDTVPGLIVVSSGSVENKDVTKVTNQPSAVDTNKVEGIAAQNNEFSLRSAISKEPATAPKDKVEETTSAASKANADIAVGAATEPNKGGVDKSVIGIIVAGMVLVVAAVTIKKNWKSIKNKFNSSPRTANDRAHTNGTTPEEVPLQQKLPV